MTLLIFAPSDLNMGNRGVLNDNKSVKTTTM